MLFHITQSHTADLCPKDEGGSKGQAKGQTQGAAGRKTTTPRKAGGS